MFGHDEKPGESATHKPSLLIRLLRWKVVIPVLIVACVLLAPVLYRQRLLSQVPDIGDPFPISELLRPIPEEGNAYPLFEEAIALRIKVAASDYDEYHDEYEDGWNSSDNQLNKYLKINRAALEKWRESTERDDFQLTPVSDFGKLFYVVDVTASRDLQRWSQLEIERLSKSGEPSAALPWLRASFRSSSLITRNSTMLDHVVGAACFAMSVSSTETWMAHPDVSADQIRELLANVQESERLLGTLSTAIKVDYLVSQHLYANWTFEEMQDIYAKLAVLGAEPPLDSKWQVWQSAEPELSRRLEAHVTANHLDFVDKPRRDRPPLLDGDIFDESAVGTSPGTRLDAQSLIQLLHQAKLINAINRSLISGSLDGHDRRQAQFACLQVALASHAFYRDRSEFPERIEELLPDYLSSLPDDTYSPRPAPVIYKKNGDDAVVYSRFTNELDDGGVMVTYEEARGRELLDYGIRILTPSHPPLVAPRP